MNRGLWILAGMGLIAVLMLTVVSGSFVGSVTGAEEATRLRDFARAGATSILDPEAPVRVVRLRPEAGPRWEWRVDLSLRRGTRRDDVALQMFLPRLVIRALGTTVNGSRPAGIRVFLAGIAAEPVELRYDGTGVPVPATPVPTPVRPEAPPKPAVPSPGTDPRRDGAAGGEEPASPPEEKDPEGREKR